MPKSPPVLTHMDTDVRFFHENDERAFFERLARIPCIERSQDEAGLGLVVYLKRKPRRDDLRELIGLCHR